MIKAPERIVFEGEHGFETEDEDMIRHVFEAANRLALTPEQVIKKSLCDYAEAQPDLRDDPEVKRLVAELRR